MRLRENKPSAQARNASKDSASTREGQMNDRCHHPAHSSVQELELYAESLCSKRLVMSATESSPQISTNRNMFIILGCMTIYTSTKTRSITLDEGSVPHLPAVGGGQWAAAVLGEPHLHGHVEWKGVFVLCEALGDAYRSLNRLVRAAKVVQ